MKTWKPIEKATLKLDEYFVSGYRLVEDAWYGDDGMSDWASELPLNEWMLTVESWEEDFGPWGVKAAGTFSTVRMQMTFKDRDLANKAWKILRDLKPEYQWLEFMGFKKV